MSKHAEKPKRCYAGQKEDVFPETLPTVISEAFLAHWSSLKTAFQFHF